MIYLIISITIKKFKYVHPYYLFSIYLIHFDQCNQIFIKYIYKNYNPKFETNKNKK